MWIQRNINNYGPSAANLNTNWNAIIASHLGLGRRALQPYSPTAYYSTGVHN